MNKPDFIFTYKSQVKVEVKGSPHIDYLFDIKIGKCNGCLKNNIPVISLYREPQGDQDLRSRMRKEFCLKCVTEIFATFVVGVEPGLKETRESIVSSARMQQEDDFEVPPSPTIWRKC